MKRLASLLTLALVFVLTASPAGADPSIVGGLSTSCDGLTAGAGCDFDGVVGACVPDEADGQDDGGLSCAAVPLTVGCDGKPEDAVCLVDSTGVQGTCEEIDGGVCYVSTGDVDSGSGNDSGCAVGSPDAPSAFALLGLLLPLAMRRRRRG